MYVLVNNKTVQKYPYSVSDLMRDNPQVSFPKNPSVELLASFNVFPVSEVGTDYDPETQTFEKEGPVYNSNNNSWEILLTPRDLTTEEIARRTKAISDRIRSDRDTRLAECDWIVVKSIETEVPELEAWKAYRQALRDLPQQPGFPYDVIWPTPPQ